MTQNEATADGSTGKDMAPGSLSNESPAKAQPKNACKANSVFPAAPGSDQSL